MRAGISSISPKLFILSDLRERERREGGKLAETALRERRALFFGRTRERLRSPEVPHAPSLPSPFVIYGRPSSPALVYNYAIFSRGPNRISSSAGDAPGSQERTSHRWCSRRGCIVGGRRSRDRSARRGHDSGGRRRGVKGRRTPECGGSLPD